MQGKKIIFLFLALLLPVSIFIFLKLFGKNEFEVTPLYQDAVPVTNCAGEYKAPYNLPDSFMTQLSSRGRVELYLLHASENLDSRIIEEVTFQEVKFIRASDWFENQNIRKCVLLVPGEEDLAIVDSQGRIRGYYKSTSREDVDRLLLEVEIMLKKY